MFALPPPDEDVDWLVSPVLNRKGKKSLPVSDSSSSNVLAALSKRQKKQKSHSQSRLPGRGGDVGEVNHGLVAVDGCDWELPCPDDGMIFEEDIVILEDEVIKEPMGRMVQQVPHVSMPAGCQEMLMEFFSPPRIVPVCQSRGWPASCSWDITHGWDANNPHDRQRSFQALDELDPLMTTLSPECTMFSVMQNCNKKKVDPRVFARRLAEAVQHMNLCADICKRRAHRGRYYLLEHPSGASSWHLPSIEEARSMLGAYLVSFPQCQYGLKAPNGKPMRKLTRFLTNSRHVAEEFSKKKCTCAEHQPIEGSCQGHKLSKWAQVYPQPLINAIVDCCERELRDQ